MNPKKPGHFLRFLVVLGVIFSLSGCAGLSRRISKHILTGGGKRKRSEDIVIAPPAKKLPEDEKLTYRVRWLGIPVGTIIASVKGVKKIRGRDAYLLEVAAKTNKFCSAIYKVDDRFLSYMDKERLYTLRHEVYRREGRYKKSAVTDFDQIKHRAYFKNFLDRSEKTFIIPKDVQDALTASYYFRLLPAKAGDRIEYAVCNNEKNYQLFALIGSKGFLTTPYLGEKEVFLIQPYVIFKGKRVKKGKASGYFTSDQRRIPVLSVIKAPVFTKVTVSLERVEPAKGYPIR